MFKCCENIKYWALLVRSQIVNEVSEAVLKNCITIIAPDTTQWIKEKILMKSQLGWKDKKLKDWQNQKYFKSGTHTNAAA